MEEFFKVYTGDKKLGEKHRGKTVTKGIVKIGLPQSLLDHKLPINFEDVVDQIQKVTQGKLYTGGKSVGDIIRDGDGKTGQAIVKILRKRVRKKTGKPLPAKANRWKDAVLQARKEGHKGMLKKGTALYNRAREIYDGYAKDAIATESDIERNPFELTDDVAKEKIVNNVKTSKKRKNLSKKEYIVDALIDAKRTKALAKQAATRTDIGLTAAQRELASIISKANPLANVGDVGAISDEKARELMTLIAKKAEAKAAESMSDESKGAKTWNDAVKQAKTEGFTGRPSKGSALHLRAQEILLGVPLSDSKAFELLTAQTQTQESDDSAAQMEGKVEEQELTLDDKEKDEIGDDLDILQGKVAQLETMKSEGVPQDELTDFYESEIVPSVSLVTQKIMKGNDNLSKLNELVESSRNVLTSTIKTEGKGCCGCKRCKEYDSDDECSPCGGSFNLLKTNDQITMAEYKLLMELQERSKYYR
jgi:hypothetical protein